MPRPTSIVLLALGAVLGAWACGSDSTSGPGDAEPGDAATNPNPTADADADIDSSAEGPADAEEPADANVATGSEAADADPGIDGSNDGAASDGGADGAVATCPGVSNMLIECSQTCYGNCEGLNDASVADPSVHIGDCIYTAVANQVIYCAPYGVADPCSTCLR